MAERNPQPNPKTGFIVQRFRVQSATERQEYEKSILRSPPPGMRNYIRWLDEDHFEFGVEHAPEPAAVVSRPADPLEGAPVNVTGGAVTEVQVSQGPAASAEDGLDAKTDLELQTQMGLLGLKYDKKKFVRGVAIAEIRAARAKGKAGT
jgi:hypothetical protein